MAKRIFVFVLMVLTVMLFGENGHAAKVPTVSLTATPSTINLGANSTLSWSSTNASSCTISGVGTVALSGQLAVYPTATQTYTITATGTGGTATKSVTVTVNYPTPTVSLTATPSSINLGENSTLSWTSTNAMSCTISGVGTVALSGQLAVSPTATQTYTITATSPGGTATKNVTVTVNYPPPTVDIYLPWEAMFLGESYDISWTSKYAQQITTTPDLGNNSLNGRATISPTSTTTYSIAATSPGGTANKSITLTVIKDPPNATISVSPQVIIPGQSATLSFCGYNYRNLLIQPIDFSYWGADPVIVESCDTWPVHPTTTTTYIITLSSPLGTATAQTVLAVGVPAPNVVGMTQANAQAALYAANLVVGTITTNYSSSIPAGNVITQNPAAGAAVALGSSINLVVSSGPDAIGVPNIVNIPQASAESLIVSAGLTVGTKTTSNSSSVSAGNVISQNPAAGAIVTHGTAVAFVVSTGPATVLVPNVNGMTQQDGQAALVAAQLAVGTITTTYSNTIFPGKIITQNPQAGTMTTPGALIDLVVSLGPAPQVLPPDPAAVAPALDPTVSTTVATASKFLYTGTNPIQTGVVSGTIDVIRAAVLLGLVTDRDGTPLSGVTVSILSHPEFGQTLSRADGMFDMAVNGGGLLTVKYEKSGYLPVHRQVNAPWQDYDWLPIVALIPVDAQVTTINLTSASQFQVHRESVVTDTDGTRQATLLFLPGTTAQIVMPDGSTQPVNSLSIRATEYTVGPNGPNAMPGQLPPASGYTYAVELSGDEAIAAGAKQVMFNQPVYVYVDNFIGFPVGETVPAGYYDRELGQWIASQNGRVIKILSITAGHADIDTDGSGLVSDSTKLATLGITPAEQQQLAALYPQSGRCA